MVDRVIRTMLGAGIIAILLPALLITTNRGKQVDAGASHPQALAIESPANGSVDSDVSRTRAGGESPHDDDRPPGRDDHAASSDVTDATTSGSDGTSGGHDDHGEKTGEGKTTATTANQPEDELPANEVSGTITGEACPCTVTASAELKGTVSLRGDIMVVGGTLVARSGAHVEGNGFEIMFTEGGRADFQGSEVFTWSGDGSNANLKRDLTFRNVKRIMFHDGAGESTLRYFSVIDSGTSALGDYPVHFHLNGNSTRGTLVEGVVVVNGRNHAFVPHGSHGITFRDTIAYNTRDDAYWWDAVGTNDPDCGGGVVCPGIDNSNDIVYQHALAHTVLNDENSKRNSGFVLGAGTGNVIRDSVAVNVRGGGDCSGFHWPEFPGGKGRDQPRVWVFENNYSSSPDCHGIFVWQNSSDNHVVDDFSGNSINHGAYSNGYHYRNPDVSEMVVHAAGTRVTGGSIGRLIAPRHRSEAVPTFTIEGTRIGAFLVDNATDGGDIPGVYVINGSGLACGDVSYDDVVGGTRVILDGVEC
ncbi:MAG TPA: hypothetical protein VJ948_08225 [Acidimicrobiia bacterium]|nr:hypothetical protein [Acidimicrobiia bacterium]